MPLETAEHLHTWNVGLFLLESLTHRFDPACNRPSCTRISHSSPHLSLAAKPINVNRLSLRPVSKAQVKKLPRTYPTLLKNAGTCC